MFCTFILYPPHIFRFPFKENFKIWKRLKISEEWMPRQLLWWQWIHWLVFKMSGRKAILYLSNGISMIDIDQHSRQRSCRLSLNHNRDDKRHIGNLTRRDVKSIASHRADTSTLWRLTTYIGVVPHRYPLKFHFMYLFNKYRYWIF